MATLPPRRSVGTSRSNRQPLSPLQILLQMGFPKHRAEKALAATGDRGVQLAADWLLAHVNDPTLDDSTRREYILYLCPTGPLLEQLQNFFTQSLIQCGRNGAHNYLPHITLCSFFQAPDDSVPHLAHALKHVVEKLQSELPDRICLEHYKSSTFLGLFVAEQHNDLLKRLAVQFMREVSEYIVTEMGALDVLGTCFPWCSSSYPSLTKGGSRRRIQVEPYLKALHITLAYQFMPEHYSTLEELTHRIDTSATACWELRLYSRDTRIKGNEVHKVLYSHVPQESDELELLIGDFVYVNGEHLNSSSDGWVEGISWLTGCTGYLPKNYIERTAESDAWTLHRSVSLSRNASLDGLEEHFISRRPPLSYFHQSATETRHKHSKLSSSSSTSHTKVLSSNLPDSATGSPKRITDGVRESLYENVDAISVKSNRVLKEDRRVENCKQIPRQVYVVRHAERVDFTFGAWIPLCFSSSGTYTRKDLNMPISVPPRAGGPQDFHLDSPLTNIGLYQATLTGEAMKSSEVNFSYVYSSPSLRCIQTSTNILKAMNLDHIPIRVEPGLFEWLAWYQDVKPVWMTEQELQECGFNINLDYKSVVSVEELADKRESVEQYYLRSYYVVQAILKETLNEGGNILLLGHSATLDTCTRQLVSQAPRNTNDLLHIVHKIPYCGVAVAEENSEGKWELVSPPFPSLMHAGNIRFDWKCLLS